MIKSLFQKSIQAHPTQSGTNRNIPIGRSMTARLHRGILRMGLICALATSHGAVAGVTNWVDKHNPVSLEVETVNYKGNLYTLNESTFYVDRQMSAADANKSPYTFNNLRDALSAAHPGTEAKPMTILIAPYVYWLDDPDDPAIRRIEGNSGGTPYGLEVDCPYLHLVGMTPNPAHVVLACNRGQTQGAVGNFTMLHLKGDGLQAHNITFGNYCNVDLDYPLDPKLSRKKRNSAIVQAQLVHCSGSDKVLIRNCRFISRLNLCPFSGGRRTLFKDCYFECTDDALAGSAIYLDCNFTFFSSRPFYSTAQTGAILLHCKIATHTHGTQYLTKAPGMVTMIDTDIRTLYDATAAPLQVRWTRDDAPIVCYQHNNTLNGVPLTIDADRPDMSVDLTGTQLLNAYKIVTTDGTLYNLPNLLAGDDEWDPLHQMPAIEAAGKQSGERVTRIPVLMEISPGQFTLEAKGDSKQLTVAFSRWGGFPMSQMESDMIFDGSLRWQGSSVLQFQPISKYLVNCISQNRFDKAFEASISSAIAYGLKGNTRAHIRPLLADAPRFMQKPSLKFDKKKKGIVLDYQLTEGINDYSEVVWYRLTDPAQMDTIAVQHGSVADDKKLYTLSRADVGYYLMAIVTPRYKNSQAGTPERVCLDAALTSKRILWNLFDESKMSTDFHEVPVQYQPKIAQGFWTFDAFKPTDTQDYNWTPDPQKAWYYGTATDGAVGMGLVQQTRGARFFYTPVRDNCGNMELTLIVDPCKTAGQGFGSATGQYMDVYIKMDATTLTGYALRIERTADYDKAVVCRLMKFDHGVATPLSEPQATACFRTSCTITLALTGKTLTATARTTAPLGDVPNGIAKEVSLSATVDKLPYCSVGLQHTGTTGSSATMIHHLSVTWRNGIL